MIHNSEFRTTRGATTGRPILAAALIFAALFGASAARAGDPCGLCDTQIITNSALASCFLDEYQALAARRNGAIVVDLSNCEHARGVVEALPTPDMAIAEPDLTFMLTPAQLDCLKIKLEDPSLVLDPFATIELGSCG